MAEELTKQFIDLAGGKEIVDQLKVLIEKKASPEVVAALLADYAKTTEMNQAISTAIAALEKKIMTGDAEGTVSDAYDTLKEIADWIGTHGQEASTLTGRVSQNASDIAELKKALGTDEEGDGESVMERIEALESDKLGKTEAASTYQTQAGMSAYETQEEAEAKYMQISNLQAVPVATIQSWFSE